MSIQGEIDRINNNVSDALAATAEMGASVPETANSNDLGRLIRSIPQGTSIDVTAEVGQTIVVEEVDANGKPTAWESADYQPRTHWTERVELLPETTVEIDPDDGAGYALVDFVLEAGKAYTIKYNGVEYPDCTGTKVDVGLAFGNMGALDESLPATEHPFVVMYGAQDMDGDDNIDHLVGVMPLDGSESVTLSVEGEEYHTIPQEYIPQRQYIYEISYDQLEYVNREYSAGGGYYCAYASEIPSALLKAMLQNIPIYLKVLDDEGVMTKSYYTATTWGGVVSTTILTIAYGAGWEERDVLPVGDEMLALGISLSAMISDSLYHMKPVYIRFVSETGE